jgi:pimeloyl-ACP methyl ester carboxylesterase
VSRRRRLLFYPLALAILAYAGLCGLLLYGQDRLLYIGISLPLHDPGLHIPAFRNAAGQQIGWLATPEGRPLGTVVYFHGNHEEAWQAVQRYGPYFTQRGWRAIFFEYPGFDFRSREQPTHDGVIAGAVADMRLARHDFPDGPLYVAGNSLGAGIAAQAAGPGGAQRVLLFVPWDSMSAVAAQKFPLVPVRLLIRMDGTDYDSCAALADMGRKTFITYAGLDRIIPAPHARHLAQCLGIPPAQTFALPRATHLDWFDYLTPAQWDAMLTLPPRDQGVIYPN